MTVILWGMIILAVVGVSIWYYRKWRTDQFWREWERSPKTRVNVDDFTERFLNEGWHYEGGTLYAPGDGPR